MEPLEQLLGYPLLGRVLLNAAMIAALAAWLGVQILSRGIVFLGLAVAQGAVAGMTLAFWLRFHAMLGSLLFVLGTMGSLAAGRSQMIEGREEGKVGILYVAFLALSSLFLVLNPQGEGRMQRIFYGNVLAIGDAETWVLWGVGLGIIGLQALRWKGFLWLASDPQMARAFGVPYRRYNLLFFLLLGVGLVVLLHFAGLVVPLALMIVPAFTAFHLVTGVGRVLAAALVLAVAPMVGAVLYGVAYAPDYPLGSLIAIATLGLSLLAYVGRRAWQALRPAARRPA